MLNIFVIQRPQWKKKHPVKDAAAHQDPASLFDDDDDMYHDADVPSAGRPEAGTTASEFDGAPDEPEVNDSNEDKGMEAIEVDDSDEEPKRHQKSTTGKKVRSRNSLLYPSHLKENYRLLAVHQSVMWHVGQK